MRASGPGRPVYCSRSCSSRAYRKRRTEDHQDAVADALVSSRVETPDPTTDPAQQPTADRPLRSIPMVRQSAAPGPAAVQQPAPAGPAVGLGDAAASGDGSGQLPLALAGERTSISPPARGLSAPTSIQTSPDGSPTAP